MTLCYGTLHYFYIIINLTLFKWPTNGVPTDHPVESPKPCDSDSMLLLRAAGRLKLWPDFLVVRVVLHCELISILNSYYPV